MCEIYWFTLPALDNTTAGFSGVCILPDNRGLLFTASLEATNDAYSDGEILGSYIGLVKFENLENGIIHTELIKQNNKTLITKIEGISVKSMDKNKANIIAVSDNDDGTSWIFEITLDIN